jgi:hypothetical protein
MTETGNTAECLVRIPLSGCDGGSANRLAKSSHQGFVVFERLGSTTSSIKSAEPFEVFSAVNCCAAVVPPRRLEHHVINILRF